MSYQYYIFKGEVILGPFAEGAVLVMFKEGVIAVSDLATIEGRDDWRPLSKVVLEILSRNQASSASGRNEPEVVGREVSEGPVSKG